MVGYVGFLEGICGNDPIMTSIFFRWVVQPPTSFDHVVKKFGRLVKYMIPFSRIQSLDGNWENYSDQTAEVTLNDGF